MEAPEPRAVLSSLRRNTRKGVEARTRIIKSLREAEQSIDQLTQSSGLSASRLRYHLTHLAREGIVEKTKKGRRNLWRLTGLGQSKLDEII